jgi:hypothetical protein
MKGLLEKAKGWQDKRTRNKKGPNDFVMKFILVLQKISHDD